MKKIFAILGLLIYCGSAKAQAPDYNDLIILFADAKYEKLISSATRYIEKESTAQDALPYLWLSKGLYAMSQQGDKDPMYKNAFKESIAALGNFRKKDKDGSLFQEHIEYIDKIKLAVLEQVTNEIDAKAYKKATPILAKYYKISPDDVGAKFLEAACKYRDGDKSGANTIWKETDKKMATLENLDKLTEVDKMLFRSGVFETAECWISSKQVDKAKKLLDKVAPWFEGDEEFKTRFDSLNF
jgi:hypothetical protein